MKADIVCSRDEGYFGAIRKFDVKIDEYPVNRRD